MNAILNSIAASLLMAAAAPPFPPAGSFEAEMLEEHNLVRAEVPVPALRWSAKLAIMAQKWADTLLANGSFAHQPHNSYGENLFAATGYEATAAEIVESWAAEAANYDYRTNTCHGTCGHYIQLVWRNTREIGCWVSRGRRRQVVVCEYNPPGDWIGQRPW